MQRLGLLVWLGMLGAFAIMGSIYLWFTVFPSSPAPSVFTYFTPYQVQQGLEYSRALRISFIISLAAQCGWLLWLATSGRGAALSEMVLRFIPGRTVLGPLTCFVLLWLSLQAVSLPFTYFSSFLWQQHWGFSTQSAVAWFFDYLKSVGLELLLACIGAMLLFYAMEKLPKTWWLASAGFISVWILIASYLWPVLVSPLFNSFTPAADPAVTSMVERLADKAGLPVQEVLVMDASRRTTRANAYFAGVGETRRVVLYDNLLRNYPPDQVESVVAHELAHWRQGHIRQGMLWGMIGSVVGWGLLFLVLRISLPMSASPPPYVWVYILLFLHVGSFIASPLQNAISRHMEREADAVAVTLTENPQAAIRLQIGLAVKNYSDVAPAPYLRLFSSHPPAIERITAVANTQ